MRRAVVALLFALFVAGPATAAEAEGRRGRCPSEHYLEHLEWRREHRR